MDSRLIASQSVGMEEWTKNSNVMIQMQMMKMGVIPNAKLRKIMFASEVHHSKEVFVYLINLEIWR